MTAVHEETDSRVCGHRPGDRQGIGRGRRDNRRQSWRGRARNGLCAAEIVCSSSVAAASYITYTGALLTTVQPARMLLPLVADLK